MEDAKEEKEDDTENGGAPSTACAGKAMCW